MARMDEGHTRPCVHMTTHQVPILTRMESLGMCCDHTVLLCQSPLLHQRLNQLERKACKVCTCVSVCVCASLCANLLKPGQGSAQEMFFCAAFPLLYCLDQPGCQDSHWNGFCLLNLTFNLQSRLG